MRFSAPCLAAIVGLFGGLSVAAETTKPNIIFILADDLGLDGVGCYGSDKHKTPNIDKLAASGTRFETCYAAPLCGPSRCLLMSERFAFRTGGITNQSWRNDGPGAKSANEHPITKLLKQAGYATGMGGGKWQQVGEMSRFIYGSDSTVTKFTATLKVPRQLTAPQLEIGGMDAVAPLRISASMTVGKNDGSTPSKRQKNPSP